MLIAFKSLTLTDCLAIFGSILGLAGFTLSLISLLRYKRKVKVFSVTDLWSSGNITYGEFIVSNMSMLPLSINYLYLELLNGKILPCAIDGPYRTSLDCFTILKTTNPPLAINPYESNRFLIAFKHIDEKKYQTSNRTKHFHIKLITTRGIVRVKVKNPSLNLY